MLDYKYPSMVNDGISILVDRELSKNIVEKENIGYLMEELGEYAQALMDGNPNRQDELADLILASIVTYRIFYGEKIDLLTPIKKWMNK
jgi:NTP pyrophosphatase (non-canonical NTP hydrolase)